MIAEHREESSKTAQKTTDKAQNESVISTNDLYEPSSESDSESEGILGLIEDKAASAKDYISGGKNNIPYSI